MVVTRLGIGFGREFYLQSVPSGSIPAPAAAAVFDILTRFLTRALRGIFYTGVVLVVVAWLAGPTRPAVWLRRIVSKASGAVGGAASGSADMGAAPAWFAAHLSAIRNTVLVLAGVVLIAWTNPTSTVVAATGSKTDSWATSVWNTLAPPARCARQRAGDVKRTERSAVRADANDNVGD